VLLTNVAQAHDIQGKIVDVMGNPIADAYILNITNEDHSHTNELGQFTLRNAHIGDIISMSHLGFKKIRHEIIDKDFENDLFFVMEEEVFELDQVQVSNSVKTVNKIASIDLQTNSVRSSQEILQRVPGLFIGQHAGGGKAEQIFLRGFDIDHGTDITLRVDGMPVNMVSHAHGQGYADLHFLIPETIEKIDFGKGPYYADQGNFNTAGYVEFKTKDRLDQSSVGVEVGSFNTQRLVGLFDLLSKKEKQSAYLASEFLLSDGPFDSPQNFNRINVMGKYTVDFQNNDRISILASRFQSKWDASGQIPQRLVDNGTISRFGAVDDTEGGSTSRTNLSFTHVKTLDKAYVKTQAYFNQYTFELFSNFTFFLEDPINGDQIRQFEDRKIYGVHSTIFHSLRVGDVNLDLSSGVGLRYDDVNNVELSRTANRKTTLENLALGQVDETNLYGFINAEFDLGKWMINPALRLDYLNFDYVDQITPAYTSLSESKAFVSPKLNIIYNPNNKWHLFFKSGLGFHSNDTRVVVAQQGEEILPGAYGLDLGAIWKPIPRLWINTALWYLFLEQEFVYVGDAGVVEPSGKTERKGIDFGFRYQLTDRLFCNWDINYTDARSTEADKEESYIPLAPELTTAGGISYKHPGGFTGGLRMRYLKDRPANESNTIIAEGYFITDLNLSYDFGNIRLGFAVENLFDSEWNETQFATESRLFNEPLPVEEIHFTPGTPLNIRGSLTYNF
jgi:outer membrane receptor for Fe3+-dicitrate